MGFLARIWTGITQLFGLIIPFFARAGDFRGWGPGVRLFLRVLFLILVLVGLFFINQWLDPVRVFGKAPSKLLGQLFLPILFVLFLTLSWLGWWLWKLLTPEVESSAFPDIDTAWEEAKASLNKQGIDITEVPLFFILGRPAAPEDAMMLASQIPFMVRQTPRRPDAPLHVYANRDGIYVTCAGCSLTGKQAAILAGDDDTPLSSPDAGTPAVSLAGNADDGMKTIGKEEIMKTVGGGGKGPLQEIHGILTRAREEGRDMTPAERQRIRILSRKPRPALMKIPDEVDRLTTRLTHLCRLIVRDRRPYCPVNGIMVLVNLAATDSEDDATQTGLVCQTDLATVRKTFQIRCPAFAAICDLETAPGFQEFFERFPEKQRHRRVGQRFPLVPAADPDKLPTMLEGAIAFICQTLFPTWVFKFFKVEGQGPQTLESTVKVNTQLYRLMYEIRERQKPLARIIARALLTDLSGPPLFGGCYVAATGRDPSKEQAFTAGVYRRLIDEQNFVSWTEDAIKEEADYQRWTKIGYIAVTVFAVVVVVLGLLWVRSS